VYLDVNMNNVYDAWDTVLSGIAMSLDGVSSTTTDSNGYYVFTGTSCFVAHTVSYTNTTPYLSDSAQFEQTGQQPVVTVVTLPVETFNPLGDSISPNNNFGLARYDLFIDKSVQDGYASDGGIVTYSITFGNYGPVDASGAVLRDYFDAAQIVPLPSSLQLWTLPVWVVETWASGSLTLTNLPVLKSGDRYTISFQAQLFGKEQDIWNATDVFVGSPETDPLEMSIFANNRDRVMVRVQSQAGWWWGSAPSTVMPVIVSELATATQPVWVSSAWWWSSTTPLPIKKVLQALSLEEEFLEIEAEHLSALPHVLPKTGSEHFYLILAIVLLFFWGVARQFIVGKKL
jgi:uncharacterized repeat protein (TIGR01451 family)